MSGVYIHIPFCKQACAYCDFHFSTRVDAKQQMIEAMQKEIELRRAYLDSRPTTLYFGGGTPSILSEEQVNVLMNSAQKLLRLVPGGEVTLEANPDDLSFEKLVQLKQSGINRLSIGIQSFHDPVLARLNRSHDSRTATVSFELARKAGFENVSVDLMYAIPGQSIDEFARNVRRTIQMQPEHISAYALTVEPKTMFGKWAVQGKFTAVADDAAAAEMNLLIDLLEDAGYEHYEVSNFSRPGLRAQHNSNYWRQIPYLGIGPSAHSFNVRSRQHNVSNNHAYVSALRRDEIPCTLEVLTWSDRINEYLLTSLRTSDGADLHYMRTELRHSLTDAHSDYVEDLLAKKLARLLNDRLVLTRQGLFFADRIASDLFEVPPDE